ncbi:mechanosensitive ion channel family protein [Rhizorhapis suberifaciens]|uniref:Small-conductance mechanosensitive channel n=1 Tax=Rhizorhapis suberifaciens TaxID=13656 RepID=A0A840HSJ0_9SPHN|nr:mechanosensitive ion channel domain-containing protein [Rhizorhapis suberifaciens]MBB4640476.1 small-conductance mechanosensitive channel [Rhizorhapis suberifaciens]
MANKSPTLGGIHASKVETELASFWRSTSEWVIANSGDILLAILVGTGIYLLLSLARGLGMRLRSRRDPFGLAPIFGRVIGKTGQFFMIMVSAKLVAGHTSPPPILAEAVAFLFTISAVLQGAIWLRELIMGVLERRASDGVSGETLANAMGVIRIVVTVALFAIAAVVILDNLGVNVTGLVAGLGIGGIAIGLAAQGIFSDLFAALSIIFDRPFLRGETINYDQTTATVERIGLKSTRLRAITGERKIISNTNLLSKEITSFAGLDHRRMKFPLGVIYQTDPALADRIPGLLQEIVIGHGAVFIRSGFIGFGQSSLDFEVEFEIFDPDYEQVYKLRHAIGLTILRRFKEEGVEFAYPTQTTFTAAPDGTMIMPYPASSSPQ